ncbi:MAG: DUF4397 domain-containing protein [Hymenobacteraceae bacterium]|nr:DUF4397 domain-containing protein [Hymenobacteraceae bacterium]
MKNILLKSFAVLAAGFMLGSCEENAIDNFSQPVNSGAFIKFAHAAPEAPAVNFYLDNSKISALAPNNSGEEQGLGYESGSIFPASYGYSNVEAGSRTLQAITTATEGNAVVASTSVSLEQGSYYTSFLIGAPDAYETLFIKDELPAENYSQSHIRFVNLVQNAPASYDAEVVLKATSETPETRISLGNDVAYKGNTAYVAMGAQGSYEVVFNTVDGDGEEVTVKSTSFSPTAGRVYTIILRGDFDDATGAVLYRDR